MSTETSANQPERRRVKRVMDAIGLEIRSSLSDSSEAGADSDPASASPLATVNHYDLEGYATVKREFPQITDYIDTLEEHIRQLQLFGSVLEEAPTHKVILSATGIVFADDRLFQPGEIVALRLTLFPQLLKVSCSGTIVSVGASTELITDLQHSYRIVFSDISTSDVQKIDEHVGLLYKSVRQFSTD